MVIASKLKRISENAPFRMSIVGLDLYVGGSASTGVSFSVDIFATNVDKEIAVLMGSPFSMTAFPFETEWPFHRHRHRHVYTCTF